MSIKDLWKDYLQSVKVDQQFQDSMSEDAGHIDEDRGHEGQTQQTHC